MRLKECYEHAVKAEELDDTMELCLAERPSGDARDRASGFVWTKYTPDGASSCRNDEYQLRERGFVCEC